MGGRADQNAGEVRIKMECPILFSAPPPPPHFLFRSAAAEVLCTVSTTLTRCLMQRNTNKRGTLGFSVLRFWLFLDRFFGFRVKRLRLFGFGVHCGLRIFRFLSSGFRFSKKLLAIFRFCYPIWFLGFIALSYLRFSVLPEFLCGFRLFFLRFCGF